jgi:tetratricopeptide (TPR) repeat protein
MHRVSFGGLAARALAVLAAATPASLAAQTLQYTAPNGAAYYSQRDTGRIARAESLAVREPGQVGRLIELGLAQASMWQYREAIATYTRALAIEPENAVLYRYRGHRYLSIREFERGRSDLERGSRLDSANHDIWYHLGLAYYFRGEFPAAVAAFRAALQTSLNDNSRVASADWLWMSLRRAGRSGEAEAMLATLPDSMNVTESQAYHRRLQLYRGRARPEDVLDPADTAALQVATLGYGIGNWYLVNGDTARAREWFLRVSRSGYWPAFGFIAAEADLGRMR